MLNKNHITIAGNISAFEAKELTDNKLVVNFTVPTKESWKDKKTQEYVDGPTEWHKCKAFGKTAEFLKNNFSKGKPIYLEGTQEYNKGNNGSLFVEVAVKEVQHSNSSVLFLNEIRVIGNTASPVLRYMAGSEKAVLNFSLATKRWNGTTDWHKVVAFGKTAEYINSKIKDESKPLIIDGKIKTRKYQNEAGDDKYVTEIILKDCEFITVTEKKSDKTEQTPEEAPMPLPDDAHFSDSDFKDRFNSHE